MGNNLFVGSLPYSLGENQLRELFARHGTVVKVKILTEKGSGRSRGLGFVLMSTEAEAERAMKALNDSEVAGRKIFVVEARPPEQQQRQPASPAPGVYTGPERRSGKDRRKNPPAAPASPGESRPFQKKPWGKKPWAGGGKPGFGPKKPWEKKTGPGRSGDKPFWKKKSGPGGKSGGFGGRKKWGPGGPDSGRQPGDYKSRPGGFRRKPGGGFRG